MLSHAQTCKNCAQLRICHIFCVFVLISYIFLTKYYGDIPRIEYSWPVAVAWSGNGVKEQYAGRIYASGQSLTEWRGLPCCWERIHKILSCLPDEGRVRAAPGTERIDNTRNRIWRRFLFACMGRDRYVSSYMMYAGVGRQTKRDARFERSFNISRDGEISCLKWYLFITYSFVSLITMIRTLRLPRGNASRFPVNCRARPGNFQ